MGYVKIYVRDHTDQCYSNADGDIIRTIINQHFRDDDQVEVSFIDVDSVSTSFVNSAFIELLDEYDFAFIRKNLKFIDSNSGINNVIKRRFDFEVNERKKALEV